MSTQSLWLKEHSVQFPALETEKIYDVVVIGGGITGVTSAYLLKQAGLKVCLLEKGRIAGGDTGHSSAHLTYVTDTRFHELVNIFGNESAELAWKGGEAAIRLIEVLVDRVGIDCDFKRIPGYLIGDLYGVTTDEFFVERDFVFSRDRGFHSSFVPSVPGVGMPGALFPNQGRFQPATYVKSLAHEVPGDGSDVYEQTEVTAIRKSPLSVVANGITLHCGKVIIATHHPLEGSSGFVPTSLFNTKLYSYNSYVISAPVQKGMLPEALIWDTRSPYSYLRVDSGMETDRAILGGKDHKTGQQPEVADEFEQLTELLGRLTPHGAVDYQWSGQVIETKDGLPYIGEFDKNQFIATGFSGNGLTFGSLAGLMAADFVHERQNPWTHLFDVHRKQIWGGTWNYLIENLDYPYYFLHDILIPPRHEDISSIPAGEGKVIKIEDQTIAAARDEDGDVHLCSGVCTHMGCLVRWNGVEKTWDCPCHGSRFSIDGKVISGPAETPLASIAQIPDPVHH
ncbi:MAG TPA: FAD-dependent oxidoreductase [Planctomicrobium sp.]|nr:FAD-dependent oxidoreductase [Planctomicrobium sp.]